jgi:hypothetical protein
MRIFLAVPIGLAAACGTVAPAHFDAAAPPPDVAASGPDAAVRCDPTAPFNTPVPLVGFATTGAIESFPRLSPDELTLYAEIGGFSGSPAQVVVAHRAHIDDMFGTAQPISAVDTAQYDGSATVTGDGLDLVFDSMRAGWHLYVSSRASTLVDFGAPSLLGSVNSTSNIDIEPFLRADGSELWFASYRAGGAGGLDLYRAVRSPSGALDAPQHVDELASASDDQAPVISADGLTVYFASSGRPGDVGDFDIWEAHRASTSDPFSAPTLSPLSTTDGDLPGWLSPDNCRLYFYRNTSGDSNIWVASR